MITPIDIVCMQIIEAARKPETVHYHLADPARAKPRSMLEEANFHLVERAITMKQIGFDYYNNIVTYRV